MTQGDSNVSSASIGVPSGPMWMVTSSEPVQITMAMMFGFKCRANAETFGTNIPAINSGRTTKSLNLPNMGLQYCKPSGFQSAFQSILLRRSGISRMEAHF